jgi:aminoglycoside phosphotransferase (APT) family kinase protein
LTIAPDHLEAVDALERFLCDVHPATSVTIGEYALIQGGLSRQTARFSATIDGTTQKFIARSDPVGASLTAGTDRDAEWNMLDALTKRGGVPMPAARYYDGDGSRLGAKTILLDFVEGETVTSAAKRWDNADRDRSAEKLCGLLADIHSVAADELPLHIARPDDWNDYIDGHLAHARQIEEAHCEPDPVLRYVIGWLDTNRPKPAPLTLVHGELQSSNIMCDPDGALQAVDWEFTHIGDPREDLGWCKMVEVLHEPVLIRRDENRFLADYRARTGLSEDLINPRSVDYFLVLASIAVLGTLYPSIAAFARGEIRDYRTAFVAGALVTAHGEWLRAIERIMASHGSPGDVH